MVIFAIAQLSYCSSYHGNLAGLNQRCLGRNKIRRLGEG